MMYLPFLATVEATATTTGSTITTINAETIYTIHVTTSDLGDVLKVESGDITTTTTTTTTPLVTSVVVISNSPGHIGSMST
jgi:hypothetical protein